MSVGEYCNRGVVVVESGEPVREAVNLMRHQHVGNVVVVEREGDLTKPVGILTDRDVVIEILAEDVDPDKVLVGDVMSAGVVTVEEDAALLDAIELMKEKGVRRLPVVDDNGDLQGILALDDIIELISEQLSAITDVIVREQEKEAQLRK
ncbi:MAG: CBS domain-containing protein [Gammaproteobacteria bacterium]|nr:CBS domain-containing protein [Gammaproteobacteria bacterium]